jgi:uncharacterized RmlC-like cupin family protein
VVGRWSAKTGEQLYSLMHYGTLRRRSPHASPQPTQDTLLQQHLQRCWPILLIGAAASIGFHCDDVDVLLIMLSGSKRFRVAGRGVGSPIVIDHVMEPGDAIYIPATFFHSGGDSSSDSSLATESSSTLLSVAMEPADALSAHETVTTWRRARESVRRRLPGPECNSWGWAGSAEGAKMVRQILGGHESTRRFCVG